MNPDSKIVYESGDLFDHVPDNALIIHATNCIGIWGAGFALTLKKRCPAAFEVYHSYCASFDSPSDLAGSCLLIQPQPEDHGQDGKGRRWHIACLFTSLGYGRRTGRNPGLSHWKDVIDYTDHGLKELRRMLDELGNEEEQTHDELPRALYSPKFNAGRFAVPWEETSRLIDSHFGSFEREWTVFS